MPLFNDKENTEIPPELDRWNWGAFILNWIWGIGNSTYIAFLMFVPIVNIVMIFVLGAKGSKWAWKNRDWRDIEHFKSTQRKWSIAGFIVLGLLISLIYGVFSLLKSSEGYQLAMQEIRASQSVTERIGSPIKEGFFPTGRVNWNGENGLAEFRISLTGSKGKAVAVTRSVKTAGAWKLELLFVTFADGSPTIVLVNTKNLRLPGVASEV